jgi:hypothetical protein
MMTKWDSIQADILPIEPKIWGDENEFDKDLDLFDEEDEIFNMFGDK